MGMLSMIRASLQRGVADLVNEVYKIHYTWIEYKNNEITD